MTPLSMGAGVQSKESFRWGWGWSWSSGAKEGEWEPGFPHCPVNCGVMMCLVLVSTPPPEEPLPRAGSGGVGGGIVPLPCSWSCLGRENSRPFPGCLDIVLILSSRLPRP